MAKKRVAYSVDTKNKAVEMKLHGYSTKQVMWELNGYLSNSVDEEF